MYNFPKIGKQIIEINCNQKKIQNIIFLYLNLLLGINKNKSFQKRLKVKEILIISFNEKIIEKIKFLIRKSLFKMRISCIRNGIGFQKNSIYKKLLLYIPDKKKSAHILLKAIKQIDEASIYTMKNFCKKIIKQHSFNLNLSLKQKIIKNEKKLQKEACFDFWRKNYYPLDNLTLKSALFEWETPEKLFYDIKPYLIKKIPFFLKKKIKKETIQNKHEKIINQIKNIKKLWILNNLKVKKTISNLNINKHIYNKKNIFNWFKKINQWAIEKTIDYNTPKELKYFSQSKLTHTTKNKKIQKYKIFLKIENFLNNQPTLRKFIFYKAIIYIQKKIKIEKEKNEKISENDLFKFIRDKLQKEKKKKLANCLQKNYPAAIIDEFQNSNIEQTEIIENIYHNKKKYYLIFIGDPKQFTNQLLKSDISSYFKIKKKTKIYHKINVDKQFSFDMISAINQLFSNKKKPFIFKQIQFHCLEKKSNEKDFGFFHNNQKTQAIDIYFPKKDILKSEYQKMISNQCAKKIIDWITGGTKKKTWIFHKNRKKFITSSDITILVRNEYEASIIQKSLKKFNIQSTFSEKKENIFFTKEALDLLWILRAILKPTNEKLIRIALSTSLVQFSAKKIEEIKKKKLENEIRKFNKYLLIWKKYGILKALYIFFDKYKIIKNLLEKENGNKKIINIIKISEILQKTELKIENRIILIDWLFEQIQDTKKYSVKNKDEFEKNKKFIQIKTIYQSKEEKYPIVWIPFENRFSINIEKNKNIKLNNNLNKNKKICISEKKKLLEDLCLFYIALTRSKFHCSIGISHFRNKRKKHMFSESTLIYLLKNKKKNQIPIQKILNSLASKYIKLIPIKKVKINSNKIQKEETKIQKRNEITIKIEKNWKIKNYSKLINNKYNFPFHENKENTLIQTNFLKNKKIYTINLKNKNKKTKYNIHNFPIGKESGIFFHHILKLISFEKIPNEKWIKQKLKKFNFSTKWSKTIKKFLKDLFKIPLTKKRITLSKIKNKIKEMKFYIPINKNLYSNKLEKTLSQYDKISKKSEKINFHPFKGILNGYIDLVFIWKDKIYLLDYKSNWLGKNIFYYNLKSIESNIIQNRYDIQYQFYTLALHKYLKKTLINYNYKKHFGGVIYLFLRGCDLKYPNFGIYFTIPSYLSIYKLEQLLIKKK